MSQKWATQPCIHPSKIPLKLVQIGNQLVRKFDVLMNSIHICCEVWTSNVMDIAFSNNVLFFYHAKVIIVWRISFYEFSLYAMVVANSDKISEKYLLPLSLYKTLIHKSFGKLKHWSTFKTWVLENKPKCNNYNHLWKS